MNDLIKIDRDSDGTATVLGRELHQALEIKTPYRIWFPRMVEYGFIENEDYFLVVQKCSTNNPRNPYTEYIDHQLTIDMAKEICMLQRTEKGRMFRRYFIEVEKAYWQKVETIYAIPLNTPMDLKGNEIVIYSIIANYPNAYNYTLKDFQREANTTKSTVVSVLKSLLVKGYISKDIEYINSVKYCHYKIAE